MVAASEIICKTSSNENQILFKTRLANNIVRRFMHLVQGESLQQVKPRKLKMVSGEGEKFQLGANARGSNYGELEAI